MVLCLCVCYLRVDAARGVQRPFPAPPAAWLSSATARCVIARESGVRVHDRRNSGSRGKWQFEYATWRGVGGHGDPADATEAEQDYRAWILWQRSGCHQPWGQYDGCC